MRRIAACLLLLTFPSFLLAQTGMVTGRIKTPAKIGTDYSLPNPTLAPTAAASATSGNFLNSRSYRVYIGWVNLAGYTNLSPASTPDFTPPTTLKRILVTRSETAPAGATAWVVWWSQSTESHAVKHTCGSGGLDGQKVATNVFTYDCQGVLTGDVQHNGTNQTGLKALTTFNVVGNGIIGMGSIGSTIGSVLENVHSLDMTGATLKYDGATVGQALRVVSICTSGCQYTDLNAACAAETSTAANPILYQVGPGTFTGIISCSGEDHAAFNGAGVGVTTLTNPTGGCSSGTLNLGTSTNVTVSNMTIFGHRSVHWDGAGTGGGQSLFSNVDFITNGSTAGCVDCYVYTNLAAGSVVRVENFHCTSNEDGITLGDGGANTDVFLKNGTLRCFDPTIAVKLIRFNSTPCRMAMQNVLIDCEVSPSVAQNSFGVSYEGTGSGGCSSGGYAVIQGTTIRMKHNGTTAGSGVSAIYVASGVTGLSRMEIVSGNIGVQAAHATNTSASGLTIDASGVTAPVVGTRSRVSGGSGNTDYAAASGSSISLVGSDYLSAADNGRQWSSLRQTPIDTAPATCNRGDTYMDVSGAYCVCTSVDTWSNTVAVGSCV